ncbi:hypothetical protein HH214_00255 [Mucilaginibacter robiniae]|uniref:GT-D fold-like domain-containing protein n=1 Tax=Mucilaginibacter robiniae TaxID=2728022 RepID=A0A7L5E4L4_9SPHI|nr:hypothetical protein HH214_00255 [Mucilaginibacter robiniae]
MILLKVIRKGYEKGLKPQPKKKPECEQNADVAADAIYKALTSDEPSMIARFGSTEMICLCNYIGVKNHKNQFVNFIKGKTQPWWWENNIINQMQVYSGFFPTTTEKIEQFCELMLHDIPEVDVLGSWMAQESYFTDELKQATKVNFELLNPYFSKTPWTKALEGKKVLVVHPFAETIKSQYNKREVLFEDNLLPDFELETIKAVQTIAGVPTSFNDWFEALDYMKAEIDKRDYDICLIGAGAYGFPLAAHVKRMGKKGFHMGGSLQLLFGIIGKRWETANYNDTYNYARLINEHWVRPDNKEKPEGALKVEGACYW